MPVPRKKKTSAAHVLSRDLYKTMFNLTQGANTLSQRASCLSEIQVSLMTERKMLILDHSVIESQLALLPKAS